LEMFTTTFLSTFPSGFGSTPLSQSTKLLKNSTGFCRKSPIAPAKVEKVSSCSLTKDRSMCVSYVKSGLLPGGVCGFADTLSGVTSCILSQLGHFSRAKQKKVFNKNNPGTVKAALPSFGSLIDNNCWAYS